MNNNKKITKLQEKVISNNMKNRTSSYWSNLIYKQKLTPYINEYSKIPVIKINGDKINGTGTIIQLIPIFRFSYWI